MPALKNADICFFSVLFLRLLDSSDYYPFANMDNDIVLFLVSFGVLILYLIFSALTEMGTKLPWKK